MAKRPRVLTEKSALKRWESGRGQGTGKEYIPWLSIQDVPSKGLVSRCMGWKSQREHHLLSQGELRVFYWLEWCSGVTDIREQFPLWSFEDTQKIAESFGIKHPIPVTSVDNAIVVMTSDFRVTTQNGEDCIRTVKTQSDLSKPRTIAKLQIEQQYWLEKNVDWKIIIADEIPLNFFMNMTLIHPCFILDETIITSDQVPEIATYLTQFVIKRIVPLADITEYSDQYFGLREHTSLYLVKHLIARRYWRVDMNIKINPTRILTLLAVADEYHTRD
jgi:hypothetical protein